MGNRMGMLRHGMYKSRTYCIWASMKDRCKHDERYTNRGITVCKRWDKFENFLKDMGEVPEGKSIDRIDNNGDYTPNNCRWATYSEQGYNTRRTKKIVYKGETLTTGELSRITGLKRHIIYNRIFVYGWSVEETVNRLVGKNQYDKRYRCAF